MNKARWVSFAFAAIALVAGAALSPVHAQPRLPALHPAGVELSLGVGRGRVPDRGANQFGFSASAMLAWHRKTNDGNRDGLQLAVSATQHSSVWPSCADDCANIPTLRSLSVLGGWSAQRANLGPSVRALLGPSLVQSAWDSQALGIQGRVDVSTHTRGRVALVAFGQWLMAPNLGFGGQHITQAYGIGWRIR